MLELERQLFGFNEIYETLRYLVQDVRDLEKDISGLLFGKAEF
jgi:hypothetical protein